MALNNIIPSDTVRRVQLETLETISKALEKTFGPNGSITNLYKKDAFPRFTKDGISVLREIKFDKPIEQSIVANIDSICTEQVKVVGDATTSIVLLSNIIFKKLDELYPAGDYYDAQSIIDTFKKVTQDVIAKIKSHTKEVTLEDIREIATISTNNNAELVEIIYDIYKKYGFDVHITVESSINGDTYCREYDGIVLECGLYDQAFANSSDNKTATVRNPKIYAFEDPIDTPIMGQLFDTIISDNITTPITSMINKDPHPMKLVPTVIFAPKISRDFSTKIENVIESCFRACPSNEYKPPLLIVTDITLEDTGTYNDIITLCGCKKIKKYIDSNIYKEDVASGDAATIENIHSFAGSCEQVESTFTTTKVFTPQHYWKDEERTEHSEIYYNLLAKLEAEFNHANEEGKKIVEVYKYRKRINAIKGCMVDICIGGISPQDRDQKGDLLEDAVLNCRSACKDGVGFGANFEGLRAIYELMHDVTQSKEDYSQTYFDMLSLLQSSYIELGMLLYRVYARGDETVARDIVVKGIENGAPLNIRTGEYKGVLASIKTDQCILRSIAEILTIMFVTNQMILSDINRCDY